MWTFILSLFICKGDDILNTLDNNRSRFSSFIKGTAICILLIEWHMLFLVNFNHSEAMPQYFQPESVNPGEATSENSDCRFMPLISLFSHYETAVVVSMGKR